MYVVFRSLAKPFLFNINKSLFFIMGISNLDEKQGFL